jgi:hypothetical protein
VQHAPADVSDGGAEETAYGMRCIDNWLHAANGAPLQGNGTILDLITFNWGMHDYDAAPGTPGQSGSSTVYAGQLEAIVLRRERLQLGGCSLPVLTLPLSRSPPQ